MRNIFKIKKTESSNIGLDQLMAKNDLNYQDLNFNSSNSDILKSYRAINEKLDSKNNFAKNLKSVLLNINTKAILKPVYTVAATAIIILSILFLKEETNPVQYAEIEVEKGEKITLHITDNITIHLNSESTIKVPLNLKHNSEFILDGEALFDVSEKEKIKVASNGITVEATDSKFHINSKATELVAVNSISGNVVAYNSNLPKTTKLSIHENERMSFIASAGFMSVEQVHNQNFMAWHTGFFIYDQTPLDKAIEEISNYFDVPIKIENISLQKEIINAKYNSSNIDDILNNIQALYNCQISADGSKIVIN